MKINLIILGCFICFSNLFCQIKNLPKNFPKSLLNKVFCGSDDGFSEYKSGYGSFGYSNYKVDWKVTISESEGIFVEYDYNALHDKRWGRTETVKAFSLYEVNEIEDSYGDITEYVWNYRLKSPYVDYNKRTDILHSISELKISQYVDSKDAIVNIEIINPGRNNVSIYLGSNSERQCGVIKSLAEIKLEKEQEQRINNQKLEQDKVIFSEVNRLLKLDDLINANSKLQEINFQDNNIIFEQLKSEIQNKEKIRFTKIDELAKDQKFKEAFDLYKTLLNPGDYNFEKTVWLNIEEQNLVDTYKSLKDGYKSKNLNDFIPELLNEKNKSRVEELSDYEVKEFIANNKDNLSKLSVGKYNVRITIEGKIYFNEIEQTNKYVLVKKNLILYDEYKVEVNSQFLLNIAEVTSPSLYTISKKWVLNDEYKNKIIFSKKPFTVYNNNDLSPLNDLKSLVYTEQDQLNEISIDKFYFNSSDIIDFKKDFNHKKVALYIPKSITKSANDLTLISTLDYQFDRYFKLKKARSNKKIIKNIAYFTTIGYCSSWLVFRYLERHTAKEY